MGACITGRRDLGAFSCSKYIHANMRAVCRCQHAYAYAKNGFLNILVRQAMWNELGFQHLHMKACDWSDCIALQALPAILSLSRLNLKC